ARRLEELPAGSRAVVLVEVDGPADEIAFASAADVAVTWAHRNGAEAGTTDVLARSFVEMGTLPQAPDMRTRITEQYLPGAKRFSFGRCPIPSRQRSVAGVSQTSVVISGTERSEGAWNS
ncbi:MAG: SIP domain-containing protein, partial [Xanthobacteraceae bacterium]